EAKVVQMKIEIIEEPIRFHLHGIGGIVENERFGKVGLRLMNEMWQVVKQAKIPTTGINHWVYLPDGRMFVGVELRNPPLAMPGVCSIRLLYRSRFASSRFRSAVYFHQGFLGSPAIYRTAAINVSRRHGS